MGTYTFHIQVTAFRGVYNAPYTVLYHTNLVIIVRPPLDSGESEEESEEEPVYTYYSFTQIVGLIASSIPVVESSDDLNALTITSSETVIEIELDPILALLAEDTLYYSYTINVTMSAASGAIQLEQALNRLTLGPFDANDPALLNDEELEVTIDISDGFFSQD